MTTVNPVASFTTGFHDGYRHEKRKRNQGSIYLRAYKRGIEARTREDNGGEDTTAIHTHARKGARR